MSEDEVGEDAARGAARAVAADDVAMARAESLVGTVVADRYRIHNVLAMGGMGAVFTGEHIHMRKRVAIKVLHPDTEGLPGLVSRFEREAIVGAHVEHKNIASARDFGRMADGSYYLVLEFVRGTTLRALMNQGPMSASRVLRIAKQIATGLSKVHGKGIVHRDLNPRNVMVVQGSKDQVKLIDFGFAKVPVEKFNAMSVQQGTPIAPSQITADGVIFGTIGYLAPEAALGMKAVDSRSDLYALGAMLYEMLTGEPPFDGATQAAHYLQHRIAPVPPMRERAPEVDVAPALEAITRKLLEKIPRDRFQTADEVIRALDEASTALAPDSLPPRPAEVEALPVTVAGEASPVSLPRFEDVADGTPEPAVASESNRPEAPGPSSRAPQAPVATTGEAPPRSRAWLVALGVTAVAAAAAVMFVRERGRANAGTSVPATASTAAARVTSDAPSPSAAASARASSADPVASASAPRPTEVDGIDAAGWRRVVRQAPASHDYPRATKGVLALAELDEHAFDGAEMRAAALDVAVSAGGDHERSVAVVTALGEKFGTGGLDVLYDIATTRGGSEAASLANAILARPEARARGSAALRIALELREAACNAKLDLMDRVKADGDERALAQLVALRSPDCDSSTGACCLRDNAAVEIATRELSSKPHAR
ncbi:MAG TPA: protein kinase, partial [Polyangiaceae bacterium]|nr:protein kinase [Polyangiaceae bacterium]